MRKTNIGITLLSIFVTGCTSTTQISNEKSIPKSQCHVTVYQTETQALKNGPIKELCVINGTSSPSFVHTIQTAINKHKDKACGCGGNNVYIQSQTHTGLDVATVTLVAFRYLDNSEVSKAPNKSTINKSKRCQGKGGLWINDVCQINID